MFKRCKKIRTKLILSFILVTVISSIAGVLGLVLLEQTRKSYSAALVENGFVQGDIGKFNSWWNRDSALVRDVVLQTDANDIQRSRTEHEMAAANADSAFEALRKNCSTPEELALVEKMEDRLLAYRASLDRVIELGNVNRNDEAMEIFYGETRPILQEGTSACEQLMSLNVQLGNEISRELETKTNAMMGLITAVIVIAIVLSLIFAVVSARGISRPIGEVARAAGQLEQGDLKISLESGLRDEIGVMSGSFQAAASRLQAYIADLSRGLSEVASGNFNVRPGEDYRGDFVRLKESVQGIIVSLSDTILQIDNASVQVSAGADQVAAGAQSLAQGAAEQASSVEELAAAMDEMSGRIHNSAGLARTARAENEQAGMQLEACGRDMAELVGAMGRIEDKSEQIQSVVKSIEDIAFQTNILALNAAVEAARAGDAGKGFAVVADEVRTLASRAAEEARNTTLLISETVQAVTEGRRISDQTERQLQQAMQSAGNVLSAVAGIADATEEQAQAVSQITQGIDQISSVVQTNSATAEQSAAASEELSGQANLLKNLIGRFTLLDSGSRQA